MPGAELAALARELRARAEVLDEREWLRVAAPEAPAPAAAVPGETLAALAAEVEACRRCPLGSQRLHPAFGVGPADARVMVVGEGPGFEEDRKGEPFVGKAGQLLDRILASIGLSRRESVYIANIVKCHPMVDPSQPEKRGNDRPPTPEEAAACRSWLDAQIRLIAPRFIVALGNVAAKSLLNTTTGITALRGEWREYRPEGGEPIPVLPTYHPAALLRNEELKRDVWNDMKSLKKALEEGRP